jgi:hypothetical protein
MVANSNSLCVQGDAGQGQIVDRNQTNTTLHGHINCARAKTWGTVFIKTDSAYKSFDNSSS